MNAVPIVASTIQPEEPKTTPLLAALREQKQSQEKKITLMEASKSQSRKIPAPLPKPEPSEPPTPVKKGRKGKAAQPATSTPVNTFIRSNFHCL
jgi:hypothetical protein